MGKTDFEKRPKNAHLFLLAERANGRCKLFLPPKEAQGKVTQS